MGQNGSSLVTRGTNDAPRFPLTWADNHVAIIGYNFDYLTTYEIEMVHTLYELKVMESRTIIILD